jgi:hypothetical protein
VTQRCSLFAPPPPGNPRPRVHCIGGTWRLTGSSPHSRGGPGSSATSAFRTGLIPAFAGRTPSWQTPAKGGWAHPRIRGEDNGMGSWPFVFWWLIPAFAGRTRCLLGAPVRGGAHPRIRGEDMTRIRSRLLHLGSSPHSRGGLARRDREPRPRGLIPAFAGRTAVAGQLSAATEY